MTGEGAARDLGASPGGAAPLHGATALVTGASRGIGAAVARKLAGLGARVGVSARSAELLDGLAAEIERRLALQAAGRMLPFTVLDAGGTPVGMTTYMNVDAVHRRVEIGAHGLVLFLGA